MSMRGCSRASPVAVLILAAVSVACGARGERYPDQPCRPGVAPVLRGLDTSVVARGVPVVARVDVWVMDSEPSVEGYLEETTRAMVGLARASAGGAPPAGVLPESLWVACGPAVAARQVGFTGQPVVERGERLVVGLTGIPDWGAAEMDAVVQVREPEGRRQRLRTRTRVRQGYAGPTPPIGQK
jgi:hypothetical protein